jgi:alkylated DNA repair dioxygenase AlkB
MNGIDYNSLGLSIIDDFISEEQESFILDIIDDKKEHVSKRKDRNSIKRYGSDRPYRANMVSQTIPDYLDDIGLKIFESGLLKQKPDSISINEYLVGQEIRPHIDSPSSGDVIIVLSLLSDAQMKFNYKNESFVVELKSKSLIVMNNEIRYKWMHSILPVKSKRYSIVFRCSKKY